MELGIAGAMIFGFCYFFLPIMTLIFPNIVYPNWIYERVEEQEDMKMIRSRGYPRKLVDFSSLTSVEPPEGLTVERALEPDYSLVGREDKHYNAYIVIDSNGSVQALIEWIREGKIERNIELDIPKNSLELTDGQSEEREFYGSTLFEPYFFERDKDILILYSAVDKYEIIRVPKDSDQEVSKYSIVEGPHDGVWPFRYRQSKILPFFDDEGRLYLHFIFDPRGVYSISKQPYGGQDMIAVYQESFPGVFEQEWHGWLDDLAVFKEEEIILSASGHGYCGDVCVFPYYLIDNENFDSTIVNNSWISNEVGFYVYYDRNSWSLKFKTSSIEGSGIFMKNSKGDVFIKSREDDTSEIIKVYP